jgi:hypothetical protein
MLRIEPRVLHILGKHPTTELYPNITFKKKSDSRNWVEWYMPVVPASETEAGGP